MWSKGEITFFPLFVITAPFTNPAALRDEIGRDDVGGLPLEDVKRAAILRNGR
jgi:hypothetical protein